MAFSVRWSCAFVVLTLGLQLLGIQAETNNDGHKERQIKSFVHPGILVTLPMLDKIRADVQGQIEPVFSAYLHANSSREVPDPSVWLANLSYAPQTQNLTNNASSWVACKEDAFAVYTHALLWYIEQDEKHARKAIEIMDSWADFLLGPSQGPINLEWGLQAAWGAAVWPRGAEIIRHTTNGMWSNASVVKFEEMLEKIFLPLVDKGASTNGNIGLAMTEASLHIGVFTDNRTTVDIAIDRWRAQAPAYLYMSSDGPTPKRPPAERYLPNTSPVCGPACTDSQMVEYWHFQKVYGHDGICQETCRDLSHVQLGFATLVNSAETAYHQGVDLYGENRDRIIAGAEFHASLLSEVPMPFYQKAPSWLCGGNLKNAVNGSTWDMTHHHFVSRLGLQMPNVSALLPLIRPTNCWDHMCWETLTHGGSPSPHLPGKFE